MECISECNVEKDSLLKSCISWAEWDKDIRAYRRSLHVCLHKRIPKIQYTL